MLCEPLPVPMGAMPAASASPARQRQRPAGPPPPHPTGARLVLTTGISAFRGQYGNGLVTCGSCVGIASTYVVMRAADWITYGGMEHFLICAAVTLRGSPWFWAVWYQRITVREWAVQITAPLHRLGRSNF